MLTERYINRSEKNMLRGSKPKLLAVSELVPHGTAVSGRPTVRPSDRPTPRSDPKASLETLRSSRPIAPFVAMPCVPFVAWGEPIHLMT